MEEPYVLQNRVAPTHSLHAIVIWDAWKSFSKEKRSDVIRQSYEEAGLLNGDTLRVAFGLTQQEALEMGYLPYKVEALIRKSDPVDINKVRDALESVGGIHVNKEQSHEVRFPSQEYAEVAHRELAEKIPGPYWAIVKENPYPMSE